MIPQELIEKALQLTGKSMEDIYEIEEYKEGRFDSFISYPKFFTFLLSPEFIEKYREIRFKNLDKTTIDCIVLLNKNGTIVSDFGEAIYEYQSGQEQPLIELLTKICKTTNND